MFYTLLPWIDKTKLHWGNLHCNENAIDYLLNENPDKIIWYRLCRLTNEKTIQIIKDNLHNFPYIANGDKYCWEALCSNPAAIKILEENPDKVMYEALFHNTNPAIKPLLQKYIESTPKYRNRLFHCYEDGSFDEEYNCSMSKFGDPATINQETINYLYENKIYNYCDYCWQHLGENLHPEISKIIEDNQDKACWHHGLPFKTDEQMIQLIEKNLDKIHWAGLSSNPAAIHILKANLNKICWSNLSYNLAAIHLLEANPDKINWTGLSANSAAIHLLEANQDKIDWQQLSKNPAIFVLDYTKLKERMDIIREDLCKKTLHPARFEYYLETYRYDILEDEYISAEIV